MTYYLLQILDMDSWFKSYYLLMILDMDSWFKGIFVIFSIPFQILSKLNRQIQIPLTDSIQFLLTKHLVKPDNIPFQFLSDSNSFDIFHFFIIHYANQTPP